MCVCGGGQTSSNLTQEELAKIATELLESDDENQTVLDRDSLQLIQPAIESLCLDRGNNENSPPQSPVFSPDNDNNNNEAPPLGTTVTSVLLKSTQGPPSNPSIAVGLLLFFFFPSPLDIYFITFRIVPSLSQVA